MEDGVQRFLYSRCPEVPPIGAATTQLCRRRRNRSPPSLDSDAVSIGSITRRSLPMKGVPWIEFSRKTRQKQRKWIIGISASNQPRCVSMFHVVVNVGGKKFHTTLETLLNRPGAKDRNLFLDFPSRSKVFIDRDPRLFGYILNYLRDGRVHIPKNGHFIALLQQEAEYYCLDSLADRLEKELLLFHDFLTIDATEESEGTEEHEESDLSWLSSTDYSDYSDESVYSDTE
ncbi:unnamed protein product [Cylicocyclus nassatus]|uniref:BTB domain-containing protein n=1 Tax=Cylicocyclus nassatus TaxID=53992 RepID=A0AA36HGG3_CYLNA|nr:unnamed protein product [Cylicocyclus nassatus]